MSDLKKLCKSKTVDVAIEGIEDKVLTVKTALTMDEAREFVNYIADGTMRTEESEYDPFIRRVLEGAALYKFYCGIDVDDLGKEYDLFTNADIVNNITVKAGIEEQYWALCDIADELITYRKQASIAVSGMKLTSALEKIEHAVMEGENLAKEMKTEDLMAIMNKLFEPTQE